MIQGKKGTVIRFLLLLSNMCLVLLLGLSPVTLATEQVNEPVVWYRSCSCTLYGTDGSIYPCGYTLGIDKETDPANGASYEVVKAIFDIQNFSYYPVLQGGTEVVVKGTIYIPEADDYITVTTTSGNSGDSIPYEYTIGGFSGYGGYEYNGKKVSGVIKSVTADYYVGNRLIGTLSLSRDEVF